MSVNSLVRMAVAKGSAPKAAPEELGREHQPGPGPAPPPPVAVAAAAPADQHSGGDAIPTDSLTALVPTEVVVFYTSIIGVLAGVLKDSPKDTYVPLRWAILAGGVVAVAVVILVPFFANRVPNAAKLPVVALLGAETAYIAWAFVVPGSPLYYEVTFPTLPVLVGVITASGAFMIGAVFRPLSKQQ